MTSRPLRVASLLLVAAACSSGGGGGAPAAPTQLTAVQDDFHFDWVNFSWAPPPGDITGYEGEGRVGAGAWESLGEVLPPDVIGGTLELDPSAPELTPFSFRIRSVRDGARSAWSNEAIYLRGVRPPAAAEAEAVSGQGIRLTWQNASPLATGIRIDVLDGNTRRTVADLPSTATAYVDASHLRAGQPRYYQLSATHAEATGRPAYTSCNGSYPPEPVSDVVATTEAGGVRLRWANPPLEAEGIVVHAFPQNYGPERDSALLPPGTTEFLDTAASGLSRYQVELRFGIAGVPDTSAWVDGLANPIDLPLQATLLGLPEAEAVARDTQGRLALAIGNSWATGYSGPQHVEFIGDGAPPAHELGTNQSWVPPEVLFDPADRPHVMVLRPVEGAPGELALVHGWYDGSAWQEEEVARRSFDTIDSIRFACDAAGELHAAWTLAAGTVAEYARRADGGWQIEDLSSVWPAGARLVGCVTFNRCNAAETLAVDGAGAPALLAQGTLTQSIVRKAPAWTVDALPGPGVAGALAAPSSGISVHQYRCGPGPDPGHPEGHVVLLRRAADAWAEEALRDFGVCVPAEVGLRATTAGDRWLAWNAPETGGTLRVWIGDGTAWTAAGDTGLYDAAVSSAWLDAAGKAGLLVRTRGSYALYVEP